MSGKMSTSACAGLLTGVPPGSCTLVVQARTARVWCRGRRILFSVALLTFPCPLSPACEIANERRCHSLSLSQYTSAFVTHTHTRVCMRLCMCEYMSRDVSRMYVCMHKHNIYKKMCFTLIVTAASYDSAPPHTLLAENAVVPFNHDPPSKGGPASSGGGKIKTVFPSPLVWFCPPASPFFSASSSLHSPLLLSHSQCVHSSSVLETLD